MTDRHRQLQRALVVDDNAPLRAAIARWLRDWGLEVVEAGTASEAKALLDPPPDLMIVDVRLPDDTALGVIEAASKVSPVPLKVAISGEASPEEAFELARRGVRAYLPKPFTLQELSDAVMDASREIPELELLVAELVGHVPMREVQGHVRKVMVEQALTLSSGSRSGAARLLDVTRQAVQQMVRRAQPSTRQAASKETTTKHPPSPPVR
jgi:DNA-binding NtrC family response regulator